MPRKQKKPQARYSATPWKPLRGWTTSMIGAEVTISGMFVQYDKIAPGAYPRILLLPPCTALVTSERTCLPRFLNDGARFFPAQWHPQANPKDKAFLIGRFTVDLRECHEETEEVTRTVYRIVP